ncbi:hypothetical protein RKD47_002666 [Streptomyces albogriseolus]
MVGARQGHRERRSNHAATLASVTSGPRRGNSTALRSCARNETYPPTRTRASTSPTHRRVEYFVPVPDSDPDQYMSFSFSALIAPGSDPVFYDILVELFDASMGTFRWSYA